MSQSTDIPKEYTASITEPKWRDTWDESMYYFDWESEKPQYIIDTPPPYPTGNFHIGNALNWCYIDFVARYKRMRGYNVMFPQGWDCHGLPTEVKVEETHGITKNQVDRHEFRRMCEELTAGNIEKMRQTMKNLAFSNDWSNEYITMEPSYFRKTQTSFVRMHGNNMLYQQEFPVNWCPRCETAIALAEVEYDSNTTKLNYLQFDKLKIATSRPELLAACVAVAVNPDDERYGKYVGTQVEVPLFGYKVTVIADSEVDTEFGTGAVMICTFGDKQDVRWWQEHNLPLRKAIERDGTMAEIAGKYQGMTIAQCKAAVIADLKTEGHLYEQEDLEQNVGLCWRCKTAIEILSERQWFIKIDHDAILSTADEIDWIPDYMKVRLENWTKTMEWDWCISRQRIFATPIPVWYCTKCGIAHVAKEEWLPIDPTRESPPDGYTCECESTEFTPELDVLDTWMDSSLTALHVSGWLNTNGHKLLAPTQLRPQGHDIIRTWAFYTILRAKALENVRPWDTILINGMVLGEDGHKMSKSLGNIISPEAVIKDHSADAFRQWAAIGGSPGSDVMFRWKDVVAGSRFQQKLWSIFRFSMNHIQDYTPPESTPKNLELMDRWLLSKLNAVIDDVTTAMETYQFDTAIKAIRGFAWEVLADNYIEIAKSRLYSDDGGPRDSARYTLYTTIDAMSRMLAPLIPFFAEEMYYTLCNTSVHASLWPEVDRNLIDPEAESEGERIKEIVATIRRCKSDNKIALNAPLAGIEIYGTLSDVSDIAGAVNSSVELISGKPDFEHVPVAVKPNLAFIGPRFKDMAGAVIAALKSADPVDILSQIETGTISITVEAGGKTVELPPEAVDIITAISSRGRSVEVMEISDLFVLILK